eukprot:PhF_6_TR38288/c0_g1_i1/m.57124
MYRRVSLLLKKSGKPTDLPDYKYAYTYWEDAGPTAEAVARARQKFISVPFWKTGKKVDVVTVPENMYTYGKEGMQLPISIFKDQPDPVIGPEWTYPGIYEIKTSSRPTNFEALVEKMTNDPNGLNYWEAKSLKVRSNSMAGLALNRLGKIKRRNFIPHQREKGKKAKSRAETAAQKKAEAAAAKTSAPPAQSPAGKK